jgi:protein-disulfide isomerase
MGFLFLSLIFANVYSAVMAYLSVGVLGVLCVMCFATYIANFLMLLLFPAAMGLRYAEVPSFVGRYLGSVVGSSGGSPAKDLKPRLGLHLGLTLAIAAFGLVFFFGLNPAVHRPYIPVPRDLYVKAFNALPVQEIDVSGRPFWGNPRAKVKIVAFSDFQCPFCRRAAFTLKPYLKSYKDDVAVYFMNYPLDSVCNPAIEQEGHPVACLAAKAGVCAAKQGKFWDYHDRVFENQKRLSRAVLVDLAAKVGLDGPAFESCLASDEVLEAVKKDAEEGAKLELKGTPAIYVNGRFFRDWPDPERVRMVIESERAK